MKKARSARIASRAMAVMRKPVMVLTALVMVLGNFLGLIGPSVTAAWADGETGYVQTGREIRYGNGGKTNEFYVNGTLAYCSDPDFDTPHSGTYPMQDAKTRPNYAGTAQHPIEALKAMVYYGWGGPGFNKQMWPTADWDGSSITDDEYLAYTHILAADRMWCQGNKALSGTSVAFQRWFCHEFLGYEYGTPGGPTTNPDAVAFRFQNAGAPADFRILELDTGNNSIYTPGGKSQTILTFEPKVGVRFTKCSADAEFTAKNPEYSVAGAEYDIYLAKTGEKAAHIVMDESGHADLKLLPNEIYRAVETKAPKGYKLSPDRTYFTTGNTTSEEQLVDDPGTVVFRVQKKDSASNGTAQPGVSLEGAECKIIDANGNTRTVTTNANGIAMARDLPFGKIKVVETKAPVGYKLDPTPREYTISSSQMTDAGIIELEPEDDFVENVVAFDIELVKYKDTGEEGSGLQDAARDVRFEIISNTTGKAVGPIVTDHRGYASTRGEWFGSGTPVEGKIVVASDGNAIISLRAPEDQKVVIANVLIDLGGWPICPTSSYHVKINIKYARCAHRPHPYGKGVVVVFEAIMFLALVTVLVIVAKL